MVGGRYRLVHRYVGREYLSSLLVAFAFFFFIFFINQILLIAQKVLVKNVSLGNVFHLVVLAIPQFLLYTFPFSSLTASAMVIGEFSTTGEILAMRSNGISMKQVFVPICVFALALSALTLVTADRLLPASSRAYKDLYVEMMKDLPTLELSSYASNTIGDRVLSIGQAEGSTVHDLVMFTTGEQGQEQEALTSPKATIRWEDPTSFVYGMTVDQPTILMTDPQKRDSWSIVTAKEAYLSLDFSSQVPQISNTLPSQLSIHELQAKSKEKQQGLLQDRASWQNRLRRQWGSLATTTSLEEFNSGWKEYQQRKNAPPIAFYYQYYRAELQKKFALSLACFLLVFLTFPMAYLRIRHGRLVGFAVAMLSSVAYWYLLFFAQLQIFETPMDPWVFIWMPDMILFCLGLLLLKVAKR